MTGSGKPYLFAGLSFVLRTILVLLCFYLLLQVGWQHLLAALAGFIITRTVLTFRLRPEERKEPR
jgi:F1F0 ATPase subunit 2